MQVTVASRHPYRGKPVVLAADLGGRERRHAVHGASILLVCLLCRLPVLALSPFASLAFDLVLLFGNWLFTLRCDADGRVTRALAWTLRLLTIAASMLATVHVLELPLWLRVDSLYGSLVFGLQPAVGILFLAARLHSFGLPKVARRMLWVLASCIAGWLVVLFAPGPYGQVVAYLFLGLPLYLLTSVWAFVVMLRLRRALKVERQEWWLDLEARPRVEWTSYALLGDRRVELVSPEGKSSWFESHSDASYWLTECGFCPRDQAMREQLIPEGALAPVLQTRVRMG